MSAPTHAELVARAATWLRSRRKCVTVIVEAGSPRTHEIPDAIGWTANGLSTLVECKTTIGDFRADRTKKHRGPEGMGTARFFLAPVGVIPLFEVPGGWGLIEARRAGNGKLSVFVVKAAHEPEWNHYAQGSAGAEIALLVAELRRVTDRPPPWTKCRKCDGRFRANGSLPESALTEEASQ